MSYIQSATDTDEHTEMKMSTAWNGFDQQLNQKMLLKIVWPIFKKKVYPKLKRMEEKKAHTHLYANKIPILMNAEPNDQKKKKTFVAWS